MVWLIKMTILSFQKLQAGRKWVRYRLKRRLKKKVEPFWSFIFGAQCPNVQLQTFFACSVLRRICSSSLDLGRVLAKNSQCHFSKWLEKLEFLAPVSSTNYLTMWLDRSRRDDFYLLKMQIASPYQASFAGSPNEPKRIKGGLNSLNLQGGFIAFDSHPLRNCHPTPLWAFEFLLQKLGLQAPRQTSWRVWYRRSLWPSVAGGRSPCRSHVTEDQRPTKSQKKSQRLKKYGHNSDDKEILLFWKRPSMKFSK